MGGSSKGIGDLGHPKLQHSSSSSTDPATQRARSNPKAKAKREDKANTLGVSVLVRLSGL
ncbi:hypothetical protein CCACVL1_26449 [Corchorus capsularis]|uniref:Uncharacterized protein n=1 Tax=Corchorus capsularis TaxID=210143 RepID=A0A1R3GET7_COCAP|nr:hypothetical protein CCACVL1_26449 [Corchorus capsularis]